MTLLDRSVAALFHPSEAHARAWELSPPSAQDVLSRLSGAPGSSDLHFGDVLDSLERLVQAGQLRAFRPITPNGPREPLRFARARA